MAKAHGIRNYAFFDDGKHARWFPSRKARDETLERLRAHAVESGLGRGSAQYGICAVVMEFRTAAARDAWLESEGVES